MRALNVIFVAVLLSLTGIVNGAAATGPANQTVFDSDSESASQIRSAQIRFDTLKATLEIGVPHPSAPLIQWTSAVIAFRNNPNALYLKAYQPLIPVYFIMNASPEKFRLFVPRIYTVFKGNNRIFEFSPDIDLKLIPQDLLEIFQPAVPDSLRVENKLSGAEVVFMLKDRNGRVQREIEVDSHRRPKRTVVYAESGFPRLEITQSDWKTIDGIEFAFNWRIRRFLPKPNVLLVKFKKIRMNPAVNPGWFDFSFPEEAKVVELTEA